MPFIGTPGPTELLIIGVIALVLFGKRLPEVARNLGKSLTEFKKGVADLDDKPGSSPQTPA
ncbi:MAG: twin-arginine translocase TatA/TatE family subunit [Planctomycetota bacterium]